MTKGRKPKPTELKMLAGNPGHRPLNSSEPRPPVPARTPWAPPYLNEYGKKEWRRLVKILVNLGLYTVVDRVALAMYCEAYGRWREAMVEVEKTGEILLSSNGNFYQNPWVHARNKAWEQIRKMLPEFGLTPSARSRLEVAKQEDAEDLASILFGGM